MLNIELKMLNNELTMRTINSYWTKKRNKQKRQKLT